MYVLVLVYCTTHTIWDSDELLTEFFRSVCLGRSILTQNQMGQNLI